MLDNAGHLLEIGKFYIWQDVDGLSHGGVKSRNVVKVIDIHPGLGPQPIEFEVVGKEGRILYALTGETFMPMVEKANVPDGYKPIIQKLRASMLWFDQDGGHDLPDRLEKAFVHYEAKHGRKPDVCYVNPLLMKDQGWGVVKIHGVEVAGSNNVLPHLFWMGQTGQG